MTDEEAAELVALAQSGQPLARSNVIESHRRIVARLVKRYERTDLSSDERIRLGEQGLVIAIEKFDDTKGFTFSAYATWRIRQAITIGPGGVSGGAGVREPRSPLPPSGSEAAALSSRRQACWGSYDKASPTITHSSAPSHEVVAPTAQRRPSPRMPMRCKTVAARPSSMSSWPWRPMISVMISIGTETSNCTTSGTG